MRLTSTAGHAPKSIAMIQYQAISHIQDIFVPDQFAYATAAVICFDFPHHLLEINNDVCYCT